MNAPRNPVLVGACAALFLGGCAQIGPKQDSPVVEVAPVYRVQQPAGTAAGQYAVGRIDLAEGRVDAAIVRFRNSLKLDPAFIEAQNGLGVALGMKGRYDEAVEAFTAVLAHSPASAHVLNNLGYAQMKAGRLHDAWRSFGQSLDLDPKNASTRENVRLLALQRGDGPPPTFEASAAKARGNATRSVVRKEAPAHPRYPEMVLSASDASVLVQLSSNVYELRPAQPQATMATAEPNRVVAGSAKPLAFEAAVSISAVPPAASVVRSAPTNAIAPRPSAQPAASAVPSASTAKLVAAPAAKPAPSGSVAAPSQTTSKRAAPRWVSRFEVSNGAGIERLAARTATQLARSGIGISRISNYERFDRVTTEIHYRKGFLEDARVVQKNLPVPAKLVASRSLRPDVNVRLVLGRDMVQARIAGWYEGDDVVASSSSTPGADGGSLDRAPARDAERVAARSVAGGWRYL